MRVNLIGTYNALEAALATKDTGRGGSSSSRPARSSVATHKGRRGARDDAGLGWRGALDVRGVEARRGTWPAYHDELGCPPSRCVRSTSTGRAVGGRAIRAFIETALAGQPLVIHGDGSQIRAWCYVDDMIEALMLVLEHPNAIGESFNIGNARSAVTIYDLALRIKRMTRLEHDLVFQALHYTDVELRVPNVDKARDLLGLRRLSSSTRARADDRLVPENLPG
jgi:UDP-glucose 4-epimerase